MKKIGYKSIIGNRNISILLIIINFGAIWLCMSYDSALIFIAFITLLLLYIDLRSSKTFIIKDNKLLIVNGLSNFFSGSREYRISDIEVGYITGFRYGASIVIYKKGTRIRLDETMYCFDCFSSKHYQFLLSEIECNACTLNVD